VTESIDRERFTMRTPCKGCGGSLGHIVEKNGQDTVRCLACDTYCYCAPRVETGRAVRSVRTAHKGVRPSLRSKILERDGHRCVLCKADNVPLHVGHVVSVDAGFATGLTDSEINDEENLIAQCEECNLGQGAQPIPLRVAIAILRARITWRNKNEATR
jgi:5-methylcytosine-specific restriction endonuclease McrA